MGVNDESSSGIYVYGGVIDKSFSLDRKKNQKYPNGHNIFKIVGSNLGVLSGLFAINEIV